MTTIASHIRKAMKSDRGTVAILVASSAIAIVLTIGLAIDGARAYSVSTRVVAALDSAALAGAKMLDEETATDAASIEGVSDSSLNP